MPTYRGTVTRITSDGAFVTVPQLGANYEFGPMPIPTGIMLATSDPVSVASVGNFKNDLIILSGQGGGSGANGMVVSDTATVDLTLNKAGDPWVLSADVKANSIPLDNISDVVLTSVATGQMLRYDGTDWVNVSAIDLPSGGTVKLTSGAITVIRSSNSDIVLETRSPTDTVNRFQLTRQSILSWGAGGSNALDTNLYRAGADVLGSDDQINSLRVLTTQRAFSSQIGGDTGYRFYTQADGKHFWGLGAGTYDTTLYRSAADLLATDDSLSVGIDLSVAGNAAVTGNTVLTGNLTVNGSKFTIGSATYRNKLSSSVVVANTTTETVIASLTIPANDAVLGSLYRIKFWGRASSTGSPTLEIKSRLGGVAGTNIGSAGPITVNSGVLNHPYEGELLLTCTGTGGSGSGEGVFIFNHTFTITVGPPWILSPLIALVTLAWDTTASKDLVVTATWNTANASNTVTNLAQICERVA